MQLDGVVVDLEQVVGGPRGEVVEHDDVLDAGGRDQAPADARADEPGPAGHEHAHGRRRYRRRAMATRVLWLTKGLGPGGTERLLVELARALDPARVRACAWPTSCRGRTTSPASWRRRVWRRCACRRAAGTRAGRCACAELVANGGFDVVHSHSPVPAVAARLAASSLPRRSPPDARRRRSTTRGRRFDGRRAGRTGSRAVSTRRRSP